MRRLGVDLEVDVKMERYSQFLVLAMVCLIVPWVAVAYAAPISGTKDGSEQWGYVDVRPGAHMFWWLYRSTSKASNTTAIPVLMWLQGGPGGSGVGVGDFREIGPLNEHLQPRKYSWVEIADLLFVENPVGTGFSYVNDPSLLPTNNSQVSSDLLQFLVEFVKLRPDLSKRPLFIFSESYGGKFASELGVMVHKAVAAGSLDLNFGGVALGDAWISPLDSMYSWGPFLYTNSRLDANGVVEVKQAVDKTAEFMRNGKFENATYQWEKVEDLVLTLSNQVDFYNILEADEAGTESSISSATSMSMLMKRSRTFRDSFGYFDAVKAVEAVNGTQTLPLSELMNTVIREKLQIIPTSVRWQSSSDEVFTALTGDFMKDTIHQVDKLLHHGVKVAVYSGQLDLICSTPGTEAWVQKLKWTGLEGFNKQVRTPLYCNSNSTGGFVKKYKNLSFYWVLKAGHYLPIDSPCVAQQMASLIMS
ncbi:hypothetical protein KC19_7G025000 [Ceratodon purpureus]|uniref:Carboxypeptidase n=1 Tax=Ceratodon purpureus TaxID=3225 RepID=A0A8T0H6Z2_CERPU|nr:hypothetical protein KC19_7G025000 [Ceratodon purpureus]